MFFFFSEQFFDHIMQVTLEIQGNSGKSTNDLVSSFCLSTENMELSSIY